MVLRMARPTKRSNSSNVQFRQRVPIDLVEKLHGTVFVATLPPETLGGEPLQIRVKVGETITFSLRASSKTVYNARHAIAQQQVNAFFEAARQGPRDLSFKEVNALCGLLYERLITEQDANPPTETELEVMGTLAEDAERCIGFGTADGRARALSILKRWFDVDAFLASVANSHRIVVNEKSKAAFIEAMPDTLTRALGTLYQRRRRDYSPDTTPLRFARLEPATPPVLSTPEGGVKTFEDLFLKWKSSGKHAPTTLSRWRGIVNRFKAFVGHDDPARVTKADALRWKDALLAEGLQKIDISFIAAMRRLYGYSLENAETTGITFNPFADVKAKQKAIPGTGRLPFTAQEVAMILTASRKETAPYLRWIPWLQAASGARVAELAQLWGSMVTTVDGIPCIKITPAPDGGTLKNVGSERTIPIHPTILADGFLNFVETRGKGPLFYGGSKAKPSARHNDEQKHPSKGVTNRLAQWVRGLGITDPRKAPNHSWRHWVKTELDRVGCSERLADAIQGHSQRSEGDRYFHASVQDMLTAIQKIDLEAAAHLGTEERAQ